MAKLLKLRRGTTTQHSSFTGAEGEVTIDTTKDTAVVHDGSQAGGRPLAREDMSNVSSIAGTKIAPDFGSQNVVTTGTLGSGDLTITDNSPQINFTDGDGNPDYRIRLNTGVLSFYDTTNSADRIVINTDGHVDVTGNLDVGAGVDVTGTIVSSGSVTCGGLISNSNVTIENDSPSVTLNDSNSENDFRLTNSNGTFVIHDNDAGATRMSLTSAGQFTFATNVDFSSGVDVTGTATATTFSGSGASLTNLPAANLTGTLPALDGSNLTGIAGIPSGVIAIWSGATSAIPSGWVICDGQNSTPDLRDRFVVGATAGTGDTSFPGVSPGHTGGGFTGSMTVSVNGNTGWASQYANASSTPNASPEPFNSRDRHQHSWGGNYSHSYDKTPPFYALAFIMKS